MSTETDLLWSPSRPVAEGSNIAGFMRWLSSARGLSFSDYTELWRWSTTDVPAVLVGRVGVLRPGRRQRLPGGAGGSVDARGVLVPGGPAELRRAVPRPCHHRAARPDQCAGGRRTRGDVVGTAGAPGRGGRRVPPGDGRGAR